MTEVFPKVTQRLEADENIAEEIRIEYGMNSRNEQDWRHGLESAKEGDT